MDHLYVTVAREGGEMGKGPYPGNVDWLGLADAARRNAIAYLQDAQLFLSHERHGRAYAMAVLGLEELGKYYICLYGASGVESPQEVWRKLDHHGAKLEMAGFAAALFSGNSPPTDVVARFENFVSEESKTKFRGLYVDWESGRVAEPGEVPQRAAADVVALLGELVTFIDGHDLDLLAPSLAEVDFVGEVAKAKEAIQSLTEHLDTLDSARAEALTRSVVDDLVATLRGVILPEVEVGTAMAGESSKADEAPK